MEKTPVSTTYICLNYW